MDERGRVICEVASVACVSGALANILPPLSAFLAVCWYLYMFGCVIRVWMRRK